MSDVDPLEDLFQSNAYDSGVDVGKAEIDIRAIIAALRVDAEFFIEFFLADQLDMPVPEFHKEIWGLLTDTEKERVLLAIPRDHAKTTLAKLVVVWYWLFTTHRFCAYLSNTAPIAKGACRDIMAFITENQNFLAVFGSGAVRIVKQSENEGIWIFDLRLPNGNYKRCMLRALGQGQQMRGINIDNQRPDIAVVDDVEDNDNTESEQQQAKLDKWMFGPFLKALARRKKIIWLGNMLTKTSLLARQSRNHRWNPVVFGALVEDSHTGELKPLWPEKWSLEALIDDFNEYRDSGLIETWMCEMMNMPGYGENGFRADQINYAPIPTPDQVKYAWITIDPAFGLNSENDDTCVSVHVIPDDDDATPMTVAEVHGKKDEIEMFHDALGLASYWNAWVWGIEAVAAQKVLISLFGLLLAGMGMLGKVEFVPLMAGRGDPKKLRISSFVSMMANKEWAIPEGDVSITTQILSYDMRKKDQRDDIIDSCAYGPIMMEDYLATIMASATNDEDSNSDVKHGTEVAGV